MIAKRTADTVRNSKWLTNPKNGPQGSSVKSCLPRDNLQHVRERFDSHTTEPVAPHSPPEGWIFAIVDAKVSEKSAVAHRALGEIELPEDTTIAAFARGPRLIVPGPATELLPGDDIIAIAHQEKEDQLRRLLV